MNGTQVASVQTVAIGALSAAPSARLSGNPALSEIDAYNAAAGGSTDSAFFTRT